MVYSTFTKKRNNLPKVEKSKMLIIVAYDTRGVISTHGVTCTKGVAINKKYLYERTEKSSSNRPQSTHAESANTVTFARQHLAPRL